MLDGYASRLHYTSDWIEDNTLKHVIIDKSKDIGGEPLALDVHYMSKNYTSYPALSEDAALIPKIAAIENNLNGKKRYFIPREKIHSVEHLIMPGDIIAITTSVKGLDYGHTGLAARDKAGTLRFMHASSRKKKVILDVSLHEHVNSFRNDTGISVLRPLELPRKECFDRWPC